MVECAGLADQSAYDPFNHSDNSGNELQARENYAEPREVEWLVCYLVNSALERAFKHDAQGIMKAIADMDEDAIAKLQADMERDGPMYVTDLAVLPQHLEFKTERKRVTGRSFYPSVIEPEFGIGRILACL